MCVHKTGPCCHPRKDMHCSEIEAIWVEILLPKTKPILCGTVYRPPNNSNFFNDLESVCLSINADSETIILGDFNVDVFKKCHLFESFNSFSSRFNFMQIINEPTRVSFSSATCIDLIWCQMLTKSHNMVF